MNVDFLWHGAHLMVHKQNFNHCSILDYIAIGVAESWLQRLFNAAVPTQSIVGSYLNYIDPYLQNWQTMYYRHHWNRLREIKTRWDPTGYFRFPQGIPSNIS